MNKLTQVEEEIMQIIWQLKRCLVRDIIDQIEQNTGERPPRSTISSVVRILEKKGFLGFKAYGKTYEYFPLIKEEKYKRYSLKGLIDSYFGGSFQQLVSFMVKKKDLSKAEIEEMLKKLDK